MRVMIYSSDKTLWALRPFAYLFSRYYSREVRVSVFVNSIPSFTLPENFSLDVIGPFKPVNEWTSDFIDALNRMSDDVILVMLEDYWINRQVDANAVRWCYGYMLTHPEVARFDLCTDRLYAAGMKDYCKINYLDVIQSDPQSPYHFSYQASLWQRQTLLDCIVPHETPWDSETRGDERLRSLGALVLGTRQGPLRYTIAVQRGKFTPDGGYQTPTNAMQAADVEYIKMQGWIPPEYL